MNLGRERVKEGITIPILVMNIGIQHVLDELNNEIV